MILSADLSSDCRERTVDQIARKIHRDLSCLYDLALSGLRKKSVESYVEIITNCPLNLVDGHISLHIPDNLVSNLFCKLDCNFLMCKSSICNQRDQRSFKLSEV